MHILHSLDFDVDDSAGCAIEGLVDAVDRVWRNVHIQVVQAYATSL